MKTRYETYARGIAAINAILFFFFWLFVLLAGADFPPPVGFLWIVFVVAVCAFVVYWRVQTYIEWNRIRRPGRKWRVIFDGILAGIIVATFFVLIRSDETSITLQPVSYAIWIAILGFMGALNSTTIYFVNTLVIRLRNAGTL